MLVGRHLRSHHVLVVKKAPPNVYFDHPFWRSPVIRLAPTLFCMAAIFGLSSRSELPRPASISGEAFSVMGHFGAYLVLAITLWWMLGMTRVWPRKRLLLAFAGAVLYGVSDEFHQSFVPGRTPDIRDITTDAIGAIVGLCLVTLAVRLCGHRNALH